MGIALGLTTVAMLFLRSRTHPPVPIQLQFFWQDQTGAFLSHRHWPVRSLSWRWVSPIMMRGQTVLILSIVSEALKAGSQNAGEDRNAIR